MDRPPPNRPMRRAGSGRFPVKVSIGGSDSLNAEQISPASSSSSSRQQQQQLQLQQQAPPIPSRSHQRILSQSQLQPENNHPGYDAQGKVPGRRPSITPLAGGNERLRSNSESVLQATKNKRMGMVTRKTSDLGSGLGTVDETRTSRFSHYRGLSHGSVMHDKPANGTTGNMNGNSSSGSAGSMEKDQTRAHFVRRLSSLPEYKRQSGVMDPTVEAAKGILYSLFLVHPYLSNLMGIVRDADTKRTSLERVFYNASTHVEELDREIHRYLTFSEDDEDFANRSNESVKRACVTCVMAYQHVCSLLSRNARKLSVNGDPRYVRTLLLVSFSCLVEVRNACSNLAVGFKIQKPTPPKKKERKNRDRSATPTRERPNPGQRLRSETVVQRSDRNGSASHSKSPRPPKINGSSRRGSSNAGSALPKSGESFAIPDTLVDTPSRSNTIVNADDAEEERQFEKIFLKLRTAYEIVLKALPSVKHQFVRCIEVCRKIETQKELRALWSTLDQHCSFAMQMAEALKAKMSSVRLKDPATRGQRDFWRLCATFVEAFVNAALLIKDARSLDLIPADILQLLRPMSKAVKEVGVHIESSPWKSMSASQSFSNPQQPQPITHSMIRAGLNNQGTTNGNAAENSASPYVSPLPATPLSAALGPAAQATVPSPAAPAKRADPLFSGNVFERADSLLSMHSRTMTSSAGESRGHTPTLLSPNGLRSNYRTHV
ncbi:MAG: RAM signaling network component [Sclerophora amabilis]|nr:MAG: RAM signaling network component [Sclerophora amabilis]